MGKRLKGLLRGKERTRSKTCNGRNGEGKRSDRITNCFPLNIGRGRLRESEGKKIADPPKKFSVKGSRCRVFPPQKCANSGDVQRAVRNKRRNSKAPRFCPYSRKIHRIGGEKNPNLLQGKRKGDFRREKTNGGGKRRLYSKGADGLGGKLEK